MNERKVTREEFLRIYNEELKKVFETNDNDVYGTDNAIYGHDVTIHWNGIYCSVSDGATAYNHIITAIQDAMTELDEDDYQWKEIQIKEAHAVYTGGNIWLFHGELEDGTYFLTDDNGCTQILNANPDDFDESLYWEWQQEHLVRDLEDEDERIDFCNKLCDKLLTDGAGGGFYEDDIEAYRQYFAEPL